MKVPFFDLKRQLALIGAELQAAHEEVFSKGIFIHGPKVEAFEEAFAKYLEAPYCISCGNATDGLALALMALGIKPGDEVIVPAFTWVSAAEAVMACGAQPVFADCQHANPRLDLEKLDTLVTPRTRAVMVVHLYGFPEDMAGVRAFCETYDLKLIEDCAHAHGAMYSGKKVGTFGDMGVFSFYPTKNLGAYGDGGAVVCQNAALAERVRLLANHGQAVRDKHVMNGMNSRLDELQAAYLLVKLKYLDEWNERRRTIARQYEQYLGSSKDIMALLEPAHCYAVYHQFVIQVKDRGGYQNKLTQAGIGTAIHYPSALSDMPFYRDCQGAGECPNATKMAQQVLSLPVFPGLVDKEITFIGQSIA